MTSRRDFLKTATAGSAGLALAFSLPMGSRLARATTAITFEPNAFLRIGIDEMITVVVKHSEMGQGVFTSLPMIVAEELDASWSKIKFEMAPAGAAYNHSTFGAQITGGSTSISTAYEQMRNAGATARAMLVTAAASKWGVSTETCRTSEGFVFHDASAKKASYGSLAGAAGSLAVPEKVTLKDPANFKIIGKETPRLDSRAKTDGSAQFGLDVHLPGMLTAVVARPPVFGGSVKSLDSSKAEAFKGVHKVVRIKTGVAVVATDFWTAKTARDLLEIIWDDSNVEKTDSVALAKSYAELADKAGAVAKSVGDAEAVLKGTASQVEATYVFPFLAHAAMEPLNCVAQVKDGGCELWLGTQFQTGDMMAAAGILGITPDKVKINTTMLGGGFGRRANKDADFSAEAVMVAAAMTPTPVRTVWTREDDMRGGYYRPMYVHKVTAGVDAAGNPSAWHQRIVGQSIMSGTAFEAFMVKDGVDVTSVEGASDMPYTLPNLQVEYHLTNPNVPSLWWRSVGHTHTAFVAETMLDELCHLGGKDPLDQRLALLAEHPRHLAVLKLVAEKAKWHQPLAKKRGVRRGRGLAVHESFGSVVAQVAEVSLSNDGKVKVDRVVCAVHCGRLINPLTVEAQMQGAIVFGLSAALHGQINMKDGRVVESNFTDYPVLRMSQMPVVEVHLVASTDAPTGVGEPGTPPIAPAVCNAIFQATGKRVRTLPIDTSSLKA